MRLAFASFCEKIEQVSLDSLETARGLWLSSSELDEKAAAGRTDECCATLVADGVQVGEWQRAKNLSPNLQKR